MADGGGNNGNGAPIETGTTVVESSQQLAAVMPKKPRKRKKSNGGSCGGATVSGCTAPDGDGKEKQQASGKKASRLVWSPKLHGKFVKACNELGKEAVPMKILRRMKSNGVSVTRAQVASHLQKYRYRLGLSKRKNKAANKRGQTTLHAASPSPPPAPPQALPHSVPPPQPQGPPMETRDMCQPQLVLLQAPPNGRSSNHVVANLLHHQQLRLLVVPPVQQCLAPPLPQIDALKLFTITEEQPSRMQQQGAAASQHILNLMGVEQAGAPVTASGAQNRRVEPHVQQPSQAMNMLGECWVPEANTRLEEPDTRMAQLQVDAKGETGRGRAGEPEAAAVASSLSPPGSIVEQYWESDDREPSWDFSDYLKRIS